MRSCVILLSEKIGINDFPLKLKVSGIRRDNTKTWQIAEEIVTKAVNATIGARMGNTDELYALAILIGEFSKN